MITPSTITIDILPFEARDREEVVALILPIQREEFGISITAADQPDLEMIRAFYQSGRGGFWVAKAGGAVVGTIGLKDIGGGQAALRKMFVAPAYRGAPAHTAARLLATLLDHARRQGLQEVILGTTEAFLAAHRFYEKHGFRPVAAEALPTSFPRMAVDTRFYALTLG